MWSLKYFCVIELEASLKKRSLESSETKQITDSSVILKRLKFLKHDDKRYEKIEGENTNFATRLSKQYYNVQ